MWPHEAQVEITVLIVNMWYRVEHMWKMFHIIVITCSTCNPMGHMGITWGLTHIIPQKCSRDTCFPCGKCVKHMDMWSHVITWILHVILHM